MEIPGPEQIVDFQRSHADLPSWKIGMRFGGTEIDVQVGGHPSTLISVRRLDLPNIRHFLEKAFPNHSALSIRADDP